MAPEPSYPFTRVELFLLGLAVLAPLGLVLALGLPEDGRVWSFLIPALLGLGVLVEGVRRHRRERRG